MRVAVAIMLMAALAGSARAAGGDEERARGHYEIAVGLYRLGDYRAALKEFAAGYELARKPGFLLNLGQTYRKLGELREARDMYRQFLAEVRSDDPARPQAQKVLAEIEAALRAQPKPKPTAGESRTSGVEPPRASGGDPSRASAVETGVESSRTSAVESPRTSAVESSRTSAVEPSRTSAVASSRGSGVDSSRTSGVDSSRTSRVDSSRTSGVDSSSTSGVDSSRTAGVDSSRTSGVDSSRTASVEPSRARGEPHATAPSELGAAEAAPPSRAPATSDAASATPAGAATVEAAAPRRSARALRIAGVTVGAVGVALLGAGIGTAVAADHDARELNALDRSGGAFDPATDHAYTLDRGLSIAFFTVGAAAGAAGVILLVEGRR